MRSVRYLAPIVCALVTFLLPQEASAAHFTVSANQGWQQVPAPVSLGQQYTISYVSGTWTVAVPRPDWGYTGIDGYVDAIDRQISVAGPTCKVVSFEPNGTLLGISAVGHADRMVMGTYAWDGSLALRINDADQCLADNGGSITVDVSPVQLPIQNPGTGNPPPIQNPVTGNPQPTQNPVTGNLQPVQNPGTGNLQPIQKPGTGPQRPIQQLPGSAGPAPLQVMALGDSWTAGFGLRNDMLGLQPPQLCTAVALAGRFPTSICDNPDAAWPALVAQRLIARGYPVRSSVVPNLAVSGSRPSHWLSGKPAQGDDPGLNKSLATITASSPDIVLLSLGANDLLADPGCLLRAQCVQETTLQTQTEMVNVFTTLTANGHTQVYAIEYPHLWLDFGGAVNLVNNALIGASLDVNAQAKAQRVIIVPAPDFATHGCFSGAASWMVGSNDLSCIHPNGIGHAELASAVVQAITSNPKPHPVIRTEVRGLDTYVWAAYKAGQAVVDIISEGARGAAEAAIKFVPLPRYRGASIAAAAPNAATVRRVVHFREGRARLRVSVPKALRGRTTKLYVRIGRRTRCIRFQPRGSCQRGVRVRPSRMVYLGKLGSR